MATIGENKDVFLQTLEGWVYMDPIHGPLYMGSTYSNTPPQSELPTQRCSRLDNKKANTPPQSEQPAQRCSRLDNKKANTPRSLNNRRSGIQDWTR